MLTQSIPSRFTLSGGDGSGSDRRASEHGQLVMEASPESVVIDGQEDRDVVTAMHWIGKAIPR